MASKKTLFIVNGAPGKAIAHAFSPDQKFLLAGTMNNMLSLTLWDIAKGKKLRTFSNLKSPANKVLFSKDGKKAIATSLAGDAIIWDSQTGKELKKLSSKDDMLRELLESM